MTCSCGSPTADGIYLCGTCAETLAYKLAEVDSVVGDLVRAVPRASLTASYGERVSASGSLHAPLPINDTALDAHIALDKYLMVTCIELAKECGPLTSRTSSGLATYLLTNIGSLRRQDWAGGVHATLAGLLRKAENVTNRVNNREFAGTCQTPDCGAELYAQIGGDTAACKVCGTDYEGIQEWRVSAKAYARTTEDNVVGYPNALAQRLASIHGETITPEHIRLLASKGALVRANPEQSPEGRKLRPMYRLGDIKALIKPKEEEAA